MRNSAFENFSEEAYASFAESALERYDFKVCERSDGTRYGVPDSSDCAQKGAKEVRGGAVSRQDAVEEWCRANPQDCARREPTKAEVDRYYGPPPSDASMARGERAYFARGGDPDVLYEGGVQLGGSAINEPRQEMGSIRLTPSGDWEVTFGKYPPQTFKGIGNGRFKDSRGGEWEITPPSRGSQRLQYVPNPSAMYFQFGLIGQ